MVSEKKSIQRVHLCIAQVSQFRSLFTLTNQSNQSANATAYDCLSSMTVIECCRTREGLVFFVFALWALATCSHFLSSASRSFPEPPRVKRLDTVSSEQNTKEVVEDVQGKGLEDKETRLQFEAWWLQQLQRKARVEEICKR